MKQFSNLLTIYKVGGILTGVGISVANLFSIPIRMKIEKFNPFRETRSEVDDVIMYASISLIKGGFFGLTWPITIPYQLAKATFNTPCYKSVKILGPVNIYGLRPHTIPDFSRIDR